MATECPFQGKFTSIKLLGRGGFGEVHIVSVDNMGKCAAKLMKLPMQLGEDQSQTGRQVARLIESEKNLCLLSHENIVKFISFEPLDSSFVIVMELLDGKGLGVHIGGKPLGETEICNFARQICSALNYMHTLQVPVIHRDLNCSNIIVLRDCTTIKLIDFGLSLRLMEVTHCTDSSAEPKGTMHFMAPELFGSGSEEKTIYSKESDIWAFGCIIYQMATGSVPHSNVRRIWNFSQVVQARGAPDLPEQCSTLMRLFYKNCTAKKRKNRLPARKLMHDQFLASNPPDDPSRRRALYDEFSMATVLAATLNKAYRGSMYP